MERYHATDDRPVSYPGREGHKRPRVDIEVIFCKGRHPVFHFECKRLGEGNPVGKYLGDDGLGCFLTEQYARESGEGGMLAYVQSDDCASWAGKVGSSMLAECGKYRIRVGTTWESCAITDEIPAGFRSLHTRPSLGPIALYHSFLLFCEPGNS